MPLAHFTNIQASRHYEDYTPAPRWTEEKLKEKGIEKISIVNTDGYKLNILYDSGMIIQYPFTKSMNLDNFLDAILGSEIKRVCCSDSDCEENWEVQWWKDGKLEE